MSLIRDLIIKLKEEGISVFLCSHLLEQVQEVCDHVGIIFEGRMRQEGTLEELVSIENRHSIVLEDASPSLIKEIEKLVAKEKGATIAEQGNPKTTLERLFLKIAGDQRSDK